MMGSEVVAVCCSDIHLSHKPPRFRRSEPNWYAAQARVLDQVRAVVEEVQAPLVVAGDLFDDGWRVQKCPPELLNFALKYLPTCYAVPGQHDLPHHRLADVERSAYWTLVEANVVKDLPPGLPVTVGGVVLHGFPWGVPTRPREETSGLSLHVAVIHSYIWIPGQEHVGASAASRAEMWRGGLGGYDVAVFGDNHRPFNSGTIHNCGALMIRKADERDIRPSVGLIHSDGTVTRRYLDTSQERYADDSGQETTPGASVDAGGIAAFVGELAGLTSRPMFDFKDAVREHLRTHTVSGAAARILTRVLEGGK